MPERVDRLGAVHVQQTAVGRVAGQRAVFPQPGVHEDSGARVEVARRVIRLRVAEDPLQQDHVDLLLREGDDTVVRAHEYGLRVDLDLFQQADEPVHLQRDVLVERPEPLVVNRRQPRVEASCEDVGGRLRRLTRR